MKPISQSRTVKFAAVLAAANILLLAFSLAMPELKPILSVEFYTATNAVVSALIIFFRTITEKPVSWPGRPGDRGDGGQLPPPGVTAGLL